MDPVSTALLEKPQLSLQVHSQCCSVRMLGQDSQMTNLQIQAEGSAPWSVFNNSVLFGTVMTSPVACR